ncbi:MAG: alpha/beta fold hydrolase [Anaerolineae bacterium]
MQQNTPQNITITTSDHYALSATLYEPPASGQRMVLLNAAMGVKQSYYADYAAYLAEQGFVVLTYDYRGIGQSRNGTLRGFPATMLNWACDDQTAALRYLTAHYPGHKLLIVGHSLGGQILGLTPDYARVSGLLGVASQSGYWRGWDGRLRLRMILLWHVVIPLLARLYGYFPARLVGMGSHDIPARVVLDWANAGRKPYYLRSEYSGTLFDHFVAVTTPLRLYSFADDDYAPFRTVENLRALYSNAPSEHRHVTPQEVGADKIGHFGFFRKQFKDSLWAESAAWLKER